MKKLMRAIPKLLIVFLIPIALLSTNYILLLNPIFLEWEYSKEDFPDPNELTVRERGIVSRSVLAYVKGITDISCLEETDLFTQKELNHLQDIRQFNSRILIIRSVSFMVLIYFTLFTILSSKKKYKPLKFIVAGSSLTILISLISVLGLYLNFHGSFNLFHSLFFPEGSWVFNYGDILLELYPRRFWLDGASAFFGISIIESSLIGLITFLFMRRSKKKKLKIDIKLNKETEGEK